MIKFCCLLTLGLLLPPAQAQAQDVVVFFHTDAIGSVRVVTDASGAVIARYDYLPFGERWDPQPNPDTRQFAGGERDAETGFDYFGARYYRLRSGLFTTGDPGHAGGDIFTPQSWNAYSYALNNPLRFVDPFGFAPCPAPTDSSTCVEGRRRTGEFAIDYIGWLLERWWEWRSQQPLEVGPLVTAPLATPGAILAGAAARGARFLVSSRGVVIETAVTRHWAQGTFRNVSSSIEYHYAKHGAGRTVAEYTDDAVEFFQKHKGQAQWGTWNPNWPPSYKLKVGNQGGYFTADGKILTYWYK